MINTLRGLLCAALSFIMPLLFLPLYLVFRFDGFYFAGAKFWARVMCAVGGVKVKKGGRQRADTSRPCVYICNHRSLFDIPVLLAGVDDNIRFMYKQELNRVPVFGWLLALSPFIAVNRADAKDAVASLEAAARQIRSGASVMIFPEGTWSSDQELLPFKRGAALLAARTGLDIVPIGLAGTESVIPPDTYTFFSHPCSIVIGEAIQCPALDSRLAEKQFAEDLRNRVNELVARAEGALE
ncbi:MAG: 1-acyl-sn-glycerol-3-phosphate acyltransferase [Candidatus Kapabacteria bacterium]|nr:1-acyl-sn-glycerol-3-phosphate acyltransferase [Candidatus Kapabacteria bacterium]